MKIHNNLIKNSNKLTKEKILNLKWKKEVKNAKGFY